MKRRDREAAWWADENEGDETNTNLLPSEPHTAPSKTCKPAVRLTSCELICANDCNYFIIKHLGNYRCEIDISVHTGGLITSWIKRNFDPRLKTDGQSPRVPMVAL